MATQVCASSGALLSTLGHPLIGHLYAPWGCFAWLWASFDLANNLPMARHVINPGVDRAQAFQASVAYVFAGSAGGALLASVVVTEVSKRGSKDKDEITEVVSPAHFWSVEEIRAKTKLLTANCGPIIGDVVTVPEKRFGPWIIQHEQREHLRHSGQTGMNIVGPQESGKSAELKTNLLIPMAHPDAHTWAEDEWWAHHFNLEPNLVVIDTKGDLLQSTSGYQKSELGKNVFIFSPFSLGPGKAHFDTLHLIRIGTPYEFDDARKAVVHFVDEGEGLKTYWQKEAVAFMAGVVASLGYDAFSQNSPKVLSHPGLIDFLTRFKKPEELITFMQHHEQDPHGVFGWVNEKGKPTKQRPWIVAATNAMAAKESEEKSGVYGSAISFINYFLSMVTRLHISDSTFDLLLAARDREKASVVYIEMPSVDLEQFRGYIRIMFRAIFAQLMDGTQTVNGREVPKNPRTTELVMDEIKTLNRLEPLAESSGNMRGHKVRLTAVWQKRSQIFEAYGDKQSLTDNLAVQKYYKTPPGDDAEWLSKRCGQTTRTIRHRNKSGQRFSVGPMGHLAENIQTVTVDNLTEYEARNLPDDEAIVFVGGAQIRVKQVRYYENPELKRRSLLPPVTVSDVTVTRPFFDQYLEEGDEIVPGRVRDYCGIGPQKMAQLKKPAPDRWAERLKKARTEKGFRIFESESTDEMTNAKTYFAAIWLPGAKHPVKAGDHATAAFRKSAIERLIKDFSQADDPDAKFVQVPFVAGKSPKDVFAAAVAAKDA